MAWFQYYLIADGTATTLSQESVPPQPGQDVVEITAGVELPPGQWDPGTLSWVPVPAPTRISIEAFRARFTEAEWDDLVSYSRGASPQAAIIDGLKEWITSGSTVNLLETKVVDGVTELESTAPPPAILAPGRAAEILDPEIQPAF